MDKVAARSVRAKANTVVGTTKIGLILRMAVDVTDFYSAMSKLALLTILASAILLEGTAHLGLVARSLLCRGGDEGTGRCLILASDSQGAT